MAKFYKGVFGPISGKIGPVIGSSWRGIPYIKSVNQHPIKRAPSAAQLLHREKFGFMTQWLKPLHPYITMGFRNLAKHNTPVNIAFSYNFKEALIARDGGWAINYEKVRLSRGYLQGIYRPKITLMDAQTLELRWENRDERGCASDDQLMLVLYHPQSGFADGNIAAAKRADRLCVFRFNQKLLATSFHVFVSMLSMNGRQVSESCYLGVIEPL